MIRKILVEFDTTDGKIVVDTHDTESVQAANIILTGAKKLREKEGILQVVLTKDVKTQGVMLDFQKDEVKDWAEVLAILTQGVRLAEFQQWMGMFVQAQQMMAQQAMQAAHGQQITNALKNKLHLP
jgi:hypothetical protein